MATIGSSKPLPPFLRIDETCSPLGLRVAKAVVSVLAQAELSLNRRR